MRKWIWCYLYGELNLVLLLIQHGFLQCVIIFIHILWGPIEQFSMIVSMGLAYERRHYIVIPSHICWAHTQNDPYSRHNDQLEIMNVFIFIKVYFAIDALAKCLDYMDPDVLCPQKGR